MKTYKITYSILRFGSPVNWDSKNIKTVTIIAQTQTDARSRFEMLCTYDLIDLRQIKNQGPGSLAIA